MHFRDSSELRCCMWLWKTWILLFFVYNSLYHSYWWLGDIRSQDISIHDTVYSRYIVVGGVPGMVPPIWLGAWYIRRLLRAKMIFLSMLSPPIVRIWFAVELYVHLDNTANANSDDFIKDALVMPWSVVCSLDLHWQWINWTPCSVTQWGLSMLCLAWLTVAQHVVQPAVPALTGRLELISQSKATTVSRFRKKIVSCEWDPRSYHNFTKNITFMAAWEPCL